MVAKRDWPCWEITKCQSQECCLSRQQDAHAKACWEIAQGLDDYRTALNVCKDCIVYISKTLADQIDEILGRKVDCVLVSHCPNYSGSSKAAQ